MSRTNFDAASLTLKLALPFCFLTLSSISYAQGNLVPADSPIAAAAEEISCKFDASRSTTIITGQAPMTPCVASTRLRIALPVVVKKSDQSMCTLNVDWAYTESLIFVAESCTATFEVSPIVSTPEITCGLRPNGKAGFQWCTWGGDTLDARVVRVGSKLGSECQRGKDYDFNVVSNSMYVRNGCVLTLKPTIVEFIRGGQGA